MEDVQHQFTILGMWNQATLIGKGVVVVLLIMSAGSLTIAIERLWRFQKAKKESLKVAVGITPLLKQHKLEEAINFAKDKKFKHSHLARVLVAGLTEFQYEASQDLPSDFDIVDSGRRAIERDPRFALAHVARAPCCAPTKPGWSASRCVHWAPSATAPNRSCASWWNAPRSLGCGCEAASGMRSGIPNAWWST